MKEKNIKVGDKITIDIEAVKKNTGGVDARFMKMADEFIEEHKDVLEALANR